MLKIWRKRKWINNWNVVFEYHINIDCGTEAIHWDLDITGWSQAVRIVSACYFFIQLARIQALEVCIHVLYMRADFTANVRRSPHILCLVVSFGWATNSLSNKDRIRVKFASFISTENYLDPFDRNFKTRICFLDLKFSLCSESSIFSFGYFPGVRLSFSDVSKPSVRSIFKGLMKNMKYTKENTQEYVWLYIRHSDALRLRSFYNREIKTGYPRSLIASFVSITNSHLVLHSRETLAVCIRKVKKKLILQPSVGILRVVLLRASIFV
jgi:hypothetical protein